MKKKVDVIIFSKNRAMQLDNLLKKVKLYLAFDSIHVLSTATNWEYEQGYLKLVKKADEMFGTDITFWVETEFKRDLLYIINNKLSSEYLMFLCDDDVIIEEIDIDRIAKVLDRFEDVYSFSTRLAPQIDYWPEKECDVESPIFWEADDVLFWNWHLGDRQGGWNSFYSLDGNVYRTDDLAKILPQCNFSNPNTLESSMRSKVLPRKNAMACFKRVKVVGIPLNIVQTSWHNKHGNTYDTKMLNDLWLKGKTISDDSWVSLENVRAVHFQPEKLYFDDGEDNGYSRTSTS